MLKKAASSVLAGHWALTGSRPSANVTLIILRVADLPAALFGDMRVLARRGRAGENDGLFEHPAIHRHSARLL